jgi:hypothetical protein
MAVFDNSSGICAKKTNAPADGRLQHHLVVIFWQLLAERGDRLAQGCLDVDFAVNAGAGRNSAA